MASFRDLTACGPAFLAVALLLSCNNNPVTPPNGGGTVADWTPEYTCEQQADYGDGLDRSSPGLGLKDAIVVTFKNGSAPAIDIPDNELYNDLISVKADGEHVVFDNANITTPLSLVVSGTAKNGSLRIEGKRRLWLYLNGVSITNPRGPAINIQNSSQVDVHLVGGCDRRNKLEDGKGYSTTAADGTDAKGTLFSEAQLIFSGSGSLEVRSKNNHAIVSDDYIVIESGNFIIYESANDGINAHDQIYIKGGTLQIKCAGEAIQNARTLPVHISGGKVTAFTTGVKSHGIAAETSAMISGSADVKITVTGNGSKGIRSRGSVTISGGTLDIRTSGNRHTTPAGQRDPDDTDTVSTAAGIRALRDLEISGGKITVNSTGESAKGFNVDGNAAITDGSIRIESVGYGMDVSGNLLISGGSVYTKSFTRAAIRCGTDEIRIPIDTAGRGGF